MSTPSLPPHIHKVVFLSESRMSLSGRGNRYLDPESELVKLLEWLIGKMGKKYVMLPLTQRKIKDKIGKFNVLVASATHNLDTLVSLSLAIETHMLVDLLDTRHWTIQTNKTGHYLNFVLGEIGNKKIQTTIAILKDVPDFKGEDVLNYKDTLFVVKGLYESKTEKTNAHKETITKHGTRMVKV